MDEEHIESKVKRKRIIVTEEILKNLLKMPIEGCKYLVLNGRPKVLKTILKRNDVDEIDIVKASSLSLEMRLMYNFISRIFLPRTGRFD